MEQEKQVKKDMLYGPRSKYYQRELAFRESYYGNPDVKVYVEQHYMRWQGVGHYDKLRTDRGPIVGTVLCGYYTNGRGRPSRNHMVWLVARDARTYCERRDAETPVQPMS